MKPGLLKLSLSALVLLVPAAASAKTPYQKAADELAKDMGEGSKVCVMPFLYIGGGPNSRGGAVVAERLAGELVKNGKLKILERGSIEKALEELKIRGEGLTDEAQAKKAGKLLGADFVVSGSMFKKNDGAMELNARAIDVETGEVKAAAKTAIKENWLEKFPDLSDKDMSGNLAFSYCKPALEALDKGDFEKAAELFTKAISVEENGACGINVPGMAYMGRAMANKNTNPSNDDSDAPPEDPGYDITLAAREKVKREMPENDEKLAKYNALIKAMPDNAEAYYKRGLIFSDKKQYKAATKDYSAAIRLAPDKPEYFYARGYALSMSRLYDNALMDLSQAIKLDPRLGAAYAGRAIIYETLSQYDKAIKDYNKAIALTPAEPVFYSDRGACFINLKQYKRSVADYNKALELNGNFTEAYLGRGLAYSGLKEYDKALKDLDKALELSPNFKKAKTARAEVADKKSGKYDKYNDDIKKGQDLFQDDDGE